MGAIATSDAQRAKCEGKGDGAAGDAEDKTFDEQAGGDFASPRAKRGTDGDLLAAAFGADQEEVGNVGAGDKQDNDDGAHEDPQHVADVADHVAFQRMHARRNT